MTQRVRYDAAGFIPPAELSEIALNKIKENFVLFDKDRDGETAHHRVVCRSNPSFLPL